jgi:hypothetical protein
MVVQLRLACFFLQGKGSKRAGPKEIKAHTYILAFRSRWVLLGAPDRIVAEG